MSTSDVTSADSRLFHKTITDDNYVKQIEELYYYGLTKFGPGAEVLIKEWHIEERKTAAESDTAPWKGVSGDLLQKIKFAGANLYGLLITSLRDIMKDSLDNAGVTRTNGTDYYATIMAMIAEIRRRNGGVSAAYAAVDNLKTLITCAIRTGEAVESYIARFNAIAKTVDATYTTPVGLAQLMVIGVQSNTALSGSANTPA